MNCETWWRYELWVDPPELTIRVSGVLIENVLPIIFFANLRLFFVVFSSGTDEVRAKRDPSLCNESVNGHFWSNLCLNCIFKWTWFVKTDIWSVNDRSWVRFPVAAALIIFFPPHFSLFFRLGSSFVPLEFPFVWRITLTFNLDTIN